MDLLWFACSVKSNKQTSHWIFRPLRMSLAISFLLSPEGITGLKELAFLRDLAEQNSVKYGVDRMSDRDCSSAASALGSAGASMMPVMKGGMMVLNQLSNLETTVGRFYINLPNRMIDLARFSLPYADPMGEGEWLGYILNLYWRMLMFLSKISLYEWNNISEISIAINEY